MRKNPHVRICGGLGSATTLVYPTVIRRERTPPARVHSWEGRRRNRLAVGLLRATFFLETIQCRQPLKSKR